MHKTKLDEIEGKLRDSIFTEVKDISDFHAHPDKVRAGGDYGIPRSVFSYADYLG